MSRLLAAVAAASVLSQITGAQEGDRVEVRDPAEPPPLPDRLSIDPGSPFFARDIDTKRVGVRFKGQEIRNCAEYCVSEGWVRRIPAGKSYRGAVKLQGAVEPYWREPVA